MPSDIGDYIQTFLGLKQVQNQTQQVAEQTRQNSLQGVNIFLQMARQTANPGTLAALADRFSELGVGNRDQLMSLLTNVTPTEEALKANQTQFGLRIAGGDTSGTEAERSLAEDTASTSLTGLSRTQRAVGDRQRGALESISPESDFGKVLERAFASQTLAGMSPGKATIDALMLGLPTPELTQAAGVEAKTRLSAEDNAQLQTAQANNRLGWAELSVRRALGEAGLELDAAKLKMMVNKGSAAGFDEGDIIQAINAKTAILKLMTDSKNKNPSDPELTGYLGGLNAVNQRLKAMGLPYEPPITSLDALKSGTQRMFESWAKFFTVK